MFVESVLPVLGAFIQAALLATLGTAPLAPLISTWTLHLCTSQPNPITPQSIPSQFTECTFTGYAAVACTFASSTLNLPSGLGVALLQNGLFACTAATPETVTSYYIKDAAGNFILGETLQTPIPILGPGSFADVTVLFPEPNSVQCQ